MRRMMRQPLKPSQEDCCNSGCNPCVFDVYDKQLKLYQAFLENGDTSGVVEENAISQLEYTKFTLLVNQELCSLHKILAFKRTDIDNGKRVLWNAGAHFLVKYIAEEEVCSRAYTPIQYSTKCNDSDFCIIVKDYDHGVVSKYLCNMIPGEKSLWRGPYGSYELIPNKYDRIIMIAQGTGIAPFYSIVQNILNNDDNFTKIELYFCCSSQDTIILRDELYTYQSYWNFQYKVFISKCEYVAKYKEPIKNRKLDFTDVKSLEPFSIKDQFLLCGSSSFMNKFKKSLDETNVADDNIVIF